MGFNIASILGLLSNEEKAIVVSNIGTKGSIRTWVGEKSPSHVPRKQKKNWTTKQFFTPQCQPGKNLAEQNGGLGRS